jgi:uncharacterized pyridoxal phosphate-containing UPF0001 family protein
VSLAESRLATLEARPLDDPALSDVRWHFIGRLQSREVERIAARAVAIHTLSSASAVRRLERLADSGAQVPELLVQVNTSGDPAKDGLAPDDVAAFLDAMPASLRVNGLMTMPAFASDPELSRPAFRQLAELAAALRVTHGEQHPLRHLDMGTSQDAVVAVEEGATIVRLGRSLFHGAELE